MGTAVSERVQESPSIPIDGYSRLCAVCQSILFVEMLAYGRRRHKHAITEDIGPLKDVARRDCPLCRLVVRALLPNDTDERSLDYKTLDLHCEISSELVGGWGVVGPHIEVYLSGGDLNGMITPHSDDYNTWARENSVRNNIEPYVTQEDSPLARPMSGTIDIPLIQSWLNSCENGHGECSTVFEVRSRWRSSAPAVFSLILIDVHEKRLVANASSESRYLTLSYVWGENCQTKETFRTKEANFDSLKKRGALSSKKGIPCVIDDAMKLVSLLGEKYLWVDALCIIQDQDKDQLQVRRDGPHLPPISSYRRRTKW
jgi:hypothetical protein